MICKPERIVDSDVKARGLLWLARELPMVTRSVFGGALQYETWASQSGLECWKGLTCMFGVCGYKVNHKCWLWNNMWDVIVGYYKEVVSDWAEIYFYVFGEYRERPGLGVRRVSGKAWLRSLDSLGKSPAREFGESQEKPGLDSFGKARQCI